MNTEIFDYLLFSEAAWRSAALRARKRPVELRVYVLPREA